MTALRLETWEMEALVLLLFLLIIWLCHWPLRNIIKNLRKKTIKTGVFSKGTKLKYFGVIIAVCDPRTKKNRYLVQEYEFPIDDIDDIIEIYTKPGRRGLVNLKVCHVEEDEYGHKTRCDELIPLDTKAVDEGMTNFEYYDQIMKVFVKPAIEVGAKLISATGAAIA